MISVYLHGTSWAHRLPAGAKLLVVAVASLLLFRVSDAWVFMACLVGVIGCYASLGRDGLERLRLLRGLTVILAAILVLHWLSDTFWDGVIVVLRLVVLILAANFVSITTRMDDMLEAVMPIFKPFTWIGLSQRKPAIGVTLVLRFAPYLLQVFSMLQEAYQARTGRRTSWRLMAPFALQSLRMSESVAEALIARGGSEGLAQKR